MAILTVAHDGDYSTFAAAEAAAIDNDTIQIGYLDSGEKMVNVLDDTLATSKTLTVEALVPTVWYPNSNGSYLTLFNTSGKTVTLKNIYFTPRGFIVSPYRFQFHGMNGIFENCVINYMYLMASSINTSITVINTILNAGGANAFSSTVSISGSNWYFYNSVVAKTDGTHIFGNIAPYNSGNYNIYNCIIAGQNGGDIFNTGTYTVNDSHNIITKDTALLTGTKYIRTPEQIGFEFLNDVSVTNNLAGYRVLQDNEVAGTTNANGVDLTSLYTTDIDGRTRTQYSIGCSEGFNTYVESDLPDETDVFLGVVYDNGNKVGTFAPYATTTQTGNLVVPTAAQVQDGVFFESSGLIEGLYDNSTNPSGVLKSYGGIWNDDYLSSQLDFINNVKIGISGGINWSGGYVASCQVPSAPANVVLDAPPSAPNITGIS